MIKTILIHTQHIQRTFSNAFCDFAITFDADKRRRIIDTSQGGRRMESKIHWPVSQ